MQREVTRERTLPAFQIDTAALELLWQKIQPLFGSEKTMRSYMKIDLAGETLNVKHPSELRGNSDLPPTLTRFTLYFSEGDRSVRVSSQTSFADRPSVRASADNEAWCAGAVKTVVNFVQSRQPWYSWLASAPYGWMVIAANLPNIALMVTPALKQRLPSFAATAVMVVFFLFLLLFFVRARVFPAAVIRLSSNENFVRRYTPEITVGLTALGVVVAVIALFVAK
jgi:hypothetical protein